MDTQFRVKRVLCEAQYGDILLCEMASGAMKTSAAQEEETPGNEGGVELAVVKQVSWARLQAKRQNEAPPLQLGDDPMLEVDVATKICTAGNHKNVVQYHQVLRGDSGSFGIVMEYCNEGDLLKRLDQLPGNRLSETEALVVLRQVASGLSFLHNVVGIAHRDVSLENLMVRDGICKIGDFGLSTLISQNPNAPNARRQTVEGRVGKLGYMAPEVCAGNAYDPVIADIWSLGISFFILLTGSPLIEMASVDCPGFRAYCRLGLRRVLTDWKMIDDFHEETLNLAERMLEVEPLNRISLHEILSHSALEAPAL